MISSNIVKKYIFFTIILISAFIMMYPLLWMFGSSFKPDYYIFKELGLWPRHFTLENYIKGWKGISGIGFGTYFKNSFVIVGLCILGNITTCSMAAYAFARLDFSFKKVLFAVMITSMMLPMHAVLIPRYIIFYKLDWIDSILPLVVPKFLATDSFFIFLMVQFIRGIPRELDNAARVDGCGPIQIFLRIIYPMIVPALVTTAIFTFIWTWNDFFSQLIYISNPKLFTIALGLRTFLDSTSESSYGQLFAMSIASMVPIFILFIAAQKLLIEGISTSGLKG